MYRILTEDKNRESIFRILDSHVDGYTVTPSIGAWRGVRESSLSIYLIGIPKSVAESIADEIKAVNAQESVLILDLTAQSIFV